MFVPKLSAIVLDSAVEPADRVSAVDFINRVNWCRSSGSTPLWRTGCAAPRADGASSNAASGLRRWATSWAQLRPTAVRTRTRPRRQTGDLARPQL